MYNFIYFKLLNWKFIGNFPKELTQYIVIAAPHTHWHDLHMGLLLRKVTNTKINFVAKKELFSWPLGWYLRKIGGFSLDRTPGQKSVDAYAKMFEKNSNFILNIAPEGTRKKVDGLKSGFYYIATGASIPIFMIRVDYLYRTVWFREPFYPTGDFDADMLVIENYFAGTQGKYLNKSFKVNA